MSSKLPWTRLFSSQWIVDVSGMSIVEKGLYMTLVLYMYEERRPIIEDAPKLARWAGCSVRVLKNTLDILLRDEKIIRLEDGRLWSLRVEEELNNSNENLNKFSERAQKAAKARWDKYTTYDCNDAKNANSNANSNAQAMLNDAINNNNNINNNKKNKNIILSKKEIDFENLETNDFVEKAIECDDVQSEQIKTIETKQPIIREQNINFSNEASNRLQMNEAMIEKLPSQKVKKVGKKLSEIFDTMMPAYFPEKANFFEETKKIREKQEVERILEDFTPDFQYATEQGLTHDEALSEFEKFVRFSKSNPCRNANERDWQSAWDNWITHPKYGLVIKKHEKVEMEKRYTTECYKSSTNNFANNLSQSFNQLATAIYAGDTYGSECIRNREVINSFANAC
ncbi:DUF1376 domain-containing protein [Bartonella taylorii]|uniref:YdaU family protein n=1 Tax=Bartonella taylorii TaxID=33046 RepID=A0A9Q9DMZ9_BARTA|nr:DUF1376 domain-containing protein [Bartonella taylorii]USP03371.1 YdaU family protein [Bartonella taylorii]